MLTKTATVLIATAITASLSSPSWAADSFAPSAAPVVATTSLAPGNAAGVHAAEDYTPDHTAIIIGGLAIIGGGIALIASGGGDHHSTSTTSSGPH